MDGRFGMKIRFGFLMFDGCDGYAGNVFPFPFAVIFYCFLYDFSYGFGAILKRSEIPCAGVYRRVF